MNVACGVFNEVNNKYICGYRDVKMVEVIINSRQVTGVISTITQSTSVKHYREIPRDYFMTMRIFKSP